MVNRVTVQDFFTALCERLRLEWVAGEEGSGRTLVYPDDQAGSLIIAGPLNLIHPSRVQLIGEDERLYLDSLSEEGRDRDLESLFAAQPAVVMLVNGVQADQPLLDHANATATPLIESPLLDSQVLDNLQYYVSSFLSEKTSLHGVFMEVLGMGVLVTGSPSVGKSELALELVSRGARLIADDAPQFTRVAPDIITGSCPEVLRDFLEVRGLGILNIRAMFGDSTIKRTKYLRLIVQIKRMTQDEMAAMERLSGTHSHRDVLGVSVPEVTVPVAAGRNLAVLVEAAVRNHLLKLKGYDAAKQFISQQREYLSI